MATSELELNLTLQQKTVIETEIKTHQTKITELLNIISEEIKQYPLDRDSEFEYLTQLALRINPNSYIAISRIRNAANEVNRLKRLLLPNIKTSGAICLSNLSEGSRWVHVDGHISEEKPNANLAEAWMEMQ
jgi:hypothetical protein